MSQTAADRNLLFGILALQMDFITRDELIAAMNAWVVAKDKPLGEILDERGALSAARRAMLEPLVDEHVRVHDGDPTRSLAAIGDSSGVVPDLRRTVADAEVHASLGHVGASGPTSPDAPTGTIPRDPAPPAESVDGDRGNSATARSAITPAVDSASSSWPTTAS